MSEGQITKEDRKVRLVVIISDVGAAVHGGGEVSRFAKSFSLPREIGNYIAAHRNCVYETLSLAIEIEDPT